MAKLRYTTRARADLAAIQSYVLDRGGSARTARVFVGRIRSRCSKLAGLPRQMGLPRLDLGPDLRGFVLGNDLIILRYADDTLEVVTVVEGHRDIGAGIADDAGTGVTEGGDDA